MRKLGRPRSDSPRYERARRGHEKKRSQAVDYLGGVCVECGISEEEADPRLQFSHNKGETKLFDISSSLTSRWERLVPELDKCSLRCHPCHREYDRS